MIFNYNVTIAGYFTYVFVRFPLRVYNVGAYESGRVHFPGCRLRFTGGGDNIRGAGGVRAPELPYRPALVGSGGPGSAFTGVERDIYRGVPEIPTYKKLNPLLTS